MMLVSGPVRPPSHAQKLPLRGRPVPLPLPHRRMLQSAVPNCVDVEAQNEFFRSESVASKPESCSLFPAVHVCVGVCVGIGVGVGVGVCDAVLVLITHG